MANEVLVDKRLAAYAGGLYDHYGPRRPMGEHGSDNEHPFFSTPRNFLGINDIVTLFKTMRCQDQCTFCTLPMNSSSQPVSSRDVLKQFTYVLDLYKDYLHMTDRFTFSNEGSILNKDTFPQDALYSIIDALAQFGSVQSVVLETRLQYADPLAIEDLKKINPRVDYTILHGLETKDPEIRKKVLGKDESFEAIAHGLDVLAATGTSYIPYILYKPAQNMSDEMADQEALDSISWIYDKCRNHRVNINAIRLNPMYGARGSKWWNIANQSPEYKPPSITRVMRIAEQAFSELGIPVWIGLETEGRAEDEMSYKGREDWKEHGAFLHKQIVAWNKRRINHFQLPYVV